MPYAYILTLACQFSFTLTHNTVQCAHTRLPTWSYIHLLLEFYRPHKKTHPLSLSKRILRLYMQLHTHFFCLSFLHTHTHTPFLYFSVSPTNTSMHTHTHTKHNTNQYQFIIQDCWSLGFRAGQHPAFINITVLLTGSEWIGDFFFLSLSLSPCPLSCFRGPSNKACFYLFPLSWRWEA